MPTKVLKTQKIGCTIKLLPSELAIIAAANAVFENPNNRPALESAAQHEDVIPPQHIAVLTSKYWGVAGVNLTVGFMESTPTEIQNMILSHMNAWSEHANVKFSLTNTDPQVRITRSGQGYWSYLGTDILMIPKNEATMCLQGFTMQVPENERRRVIRHETGHSLGCPHEHARQKIVDRLDPQKTIQYFRQTQGWSPAMVQDQVLKPLSESSLMGTTEADETSIMAYTLPPNITKDGKPILGGSDITHQDGAFMNMLYPKNTTTQPPPVSSGKKGTLIFDFQNKIIEGDFPPGSGWKFVPKKSSGVNV